MAGTYRTRSGETWDMIAYRALGSGFFMDKMIAANPEWSEIFIFPAGVTLRVPEVTAVTSETNPPWYGGSD